MSETIPATTLQVASLKRRTAAIVIDGLILFPLGLMVTFALSGHLIIRRHSPHAIEVELVGLLLALVYEFAFLVTRNATPGKLALGMYVCTEDGQAITAGSAATRAVVKNAFAVEYIPMLGFPLAALLIIATLCVAIADPVNRALHDRAASTRVVRGKPPTVIKTEPRHEAFPRP